jgi:hypothetical protein
VRPALWLDGFQAPVGFDRAGSVRKQTLEVIKTYLNIDRLLTIVRKMSNKNKVNVKHDCEVLINP